MEQTTEMKKADKYIKSVPKRLKDAIGERDVKVTTAAILAVVKWMRESGYEEDGLTELKDAFGVKE